MTEAKIKRALGEFFYFFTNFNLKDILNYVYVTFLILAQLTFSTIAINKTYTSHFELFGSFFIWISLGIFGLYLLTIKSNFNFTTISLILIIINTTLMGYKAELINLTAFFTVSLFLLLIRGLIEFFIIIKTKKGKKNEKNKM